MTLAAISYMSPELGELILQLMLIGSYSATHIKALKEYSRKIAAKRMHLKPPEQSFVKSFEQKKLFILLIKRF